MRRLAPVLVLALTVAACGSDAASPVPTTSVELTSTTASAAVAGEPAGTTSFTDLAQTHVETLVDYPQTPPVGGPHSRVWQNCQYYDTSIPNARGVHSMEHGAVWITYRPELTQSDRRLLRNLAATGDHILISEYDGLPSPVVASAWGMQLALQSIADPGLQQFVDAFQVGPQTPESGVTCRESTSETS